MCKNFRHILLGFLIVQGVLLGAYAPTSTAQKAPLPPDANGLERDIALNAARNALRNNDFEVAFQRFSQWLEGAPSDDNARAEYAGALFQAGRSSQAAEQYQMLAERYPEDVELTRLLADALLNAGDHPRATQVLRQATKKWPDRPDFALHLAQILAANDELAEARTIAERSLTDELLQDDEMRLEAAKLYLLLKDPQAAGPLLSDLIQRKGDDAEVVASWIRYNLHVGDYDASRAAAAKLDELAPKDTGLRLELAEALYAAGYATDADNQFQQVLRFEPDNIKALIGAARCALRNFSPGASQALLAEVPEDARGRVYWLAVAETHTISGEYAEARRLLTTLLQENPTDQRALIAMADLERAQQEFTKADARYATMLENGQGSRQAAFHWAESLFFQRKFNESEAVCRDILADNPTDTEAAVVLARNLRKQRRPSEAAALLEEHLGEDGLSGVAQGILFIELAQAKRELGDSGDAHRLLHAAETTPAAEVARAVLLVDLPNGDTVGRIEASLDQSGKPVEFAVAATDLAMQRGRRNLARTIIDAGLARYPDNYVLRTRNAEWYGSFSEPCTDQRAATLYRELLAEQPENDKCRLGLARAYASLRCFEASFREYRTLMCRQPWNAAIAREYARVERFACGLPTALETYDRLICKWRRGPMSLGTQIPELAEVVEATDGETVIVENTDVASPPENAILEELALLCQERTAKATQDVNPTCSRHYYERLWCEEPYEQHMAFELGQVNGNLGNSCEAIGWYNRLLAMDPNHRDARVARVGKRFEYYPCLNADYLWQKERGRDGLTSIDRGRASIGVTWRDPSDEEYLGLEYSHLTLAPTAGSGTDGNAIRTRYQKRIDALCFDECPNNFIQKTYVFGDVEVQQFDHFVSTRPMYDAGVRIRTKHDVLWTVAATMNNVLENSEALRQDIYRQGFRVAAATRPRQWWQTEVEYNWRSYSDANRMQQFDFRNRLPFTPEPAQLAVLADYRYYDFDEQTIFGDPVTLVGTIHPYWTPDEFSQADAGIEWKHWLSRDRFDGAKHCWYTVSYRRRWDSQDKGYNLWRARFHWDINRCWSTNVDLQSTDSTVYNQTGIYANLIWVRPR